LQFKIGVTDQIKGGVTIQTTMG